MFQMNQSLQSQYGGGGDFIHSSCLRVRKKLAHQTKTCPGISQSKECIFEAFHHHNSSNALEILRDRFNKSTAPSAP